MTPATDEAVRQRYRHTIAVTVAQEALLYDRIARLYRSEAQPDNPAARLATTLRHAVRDVPAYREVAVLEADFADPYGALARFPLISKRDLRDRLVDFCSDSIDPDACRFGTTSGTTGMPLKVIHSLDHIVSEYATALRRNRALGLPERRRIIEPMKTVPLPWTEYESPARWHSVVAEFGTGPGGESADVLAQVQRFNPDVVYGHPSDCVAFAQRLNAGGVAVAPRLVVTYGEYVSDAVRSYLESSFSPARVIDFYAMYEFGTIAVRCAEGRYHVEEKVFVEVVSEDGSDIPLGNVGEIVVTGLTNDVMPLIRYRTGDFGKLVEGICACGAEGRALTELVGRESGVISFDDGAEVRLSGVTRILRRYPLLRFQIVRDAESSFSVRIQPAAGFEESQLAEMRDFLTRQLFGRPVALQVVGPAEFIPDDRRKAVDYIDLYAAR
ncbi:hypothetical protein ABZZ20_05610 [Streptomyces sp. NPDC006430]|uniref:hypothetical protein n=1 Tax=Streptomyces sp. NPDC006430 TaxID=3154299 RepID=UPI0033ABBF3C